jgi:hypothetical protein
MCEPVRGNVGAPPSPVRPIRSLVARNTADHCDRLAGFCKGQDIAGVLEQDRAVLSQGERCLVVSRGTDIEALQLRTLGWDMVEEANAKHRRQDVEDHLIQPSHRYLTSFNGCSEGLAEEGSIGHLEVEPGSGRLHCRVDGQNPIRHDKPLESPLVPQHPGKRPGVLTGRDVVDEVVGAHHSADVTLGHCSGEGRKVDLLQRAHAHVGRSRRFVCLFAIGGKMLHRRDDRIALYAVDLGHGRLPCQKGVLSERFIVAPVQRNPIDVHVGREHDVDSLLPRLRAQFLAHSLLQRRIPRCCLGDRSREGRRVLLSVAQARSCILQHQLRDAELRV